MPAAELVFAAPDSVIGALAELGAGDEAILMGGGTSVTMLLKNRMIYPSKIVWLGRVPGLRELSTGPGGELIAGATVTLRELAADPVVQGRYPALRHAAEQVGNARVRAVATIGGALAHADPRQDLPPVLLSLGARLRVAGPGGEREIPLAGFQTGFMQTALTDDELIIAVIVPPPSGRCAYARFTPGSADDYPTVAAAARLELDADGRVAAAALALGGVAEKTLLCPAADSLVGFVPGQHALGAVAAAAAEQTSPFDDQRGSARYKKEMAREWALRAMRACLAAPGEPLPPGVKAG